MNTPSVAEAHRIGAEVAARHADDVDRNARFPAEAIDALREARLLSALVPVEQGGGGMRFGELAAVCSALGQYCSATAMVFAMHQIQVACVLRHAGDSAFFRDYAGQIAQHQLLLGSVTSEVGIGGETRASLCAVQVEGQRFTLEKNATTVSYGAHADDLLVTCRRDAQAGRGDQVAVLARAGQFTLAQTSQWDTLGMRGTCSPGFRFAAQGAAAQVLPAPFGEVSSATMVPYSHILWAAVWLGIASDAVGRAAANVRAAARRAPGTVPPAALRLSEMAGGLQSLRALVHSAVAEFETLQDAPDGGVEALSAIGYALTMNNLKTTVSEAAVDLAQQALRVSGIQGYRNDTPSSVGRHLRDLLSAPLMIGNDRIHAQSATLLQVHKAI